ncbi:hypothetical protein GORHZ_135_00020 [Gordonia rhizosphera NBRC 16068]|uniref:RNase H type-1 domain-containing protein n=1 Tax=Gordonia rhizosphera NBRC 16068 TaxID=1108045 RepID=K6V5F2_9ACTN|nr:hypothetical protein GORHZ_135_00020 [Gordonia rhizosphera NBRC 16068]
MSRCTVRAPSGLLIWLPMEPRTHRSAEITRLISRIRRQIAGRDVTIRRVKAHSGHGLNENG